MPGRSASPLTDAELSLDLYDLDAIFKVPSYAEVKLALIQNTKFFDDGSGDELASDI